MNKNEREPKNRPSIQEMVICLVTSAMEENMPAREEVVGVGQLETGRSGTPHQVGDTWAEVSKR